MSNDKGLGKITGINGQKFFVTYHSRNKYDDKIEEDGEEE